MRNVLLTISYDGTNFCGWQRQDGCESHPEPMRTVQAEIEEVLKKIHKEKTNLQGSGRTDSGVHAVGQTATFLSPIDSIPIQNYISALNSQLPKDIRIQDVKEVPLEFNARFNAVSRTYRYFISCTKTPFAHRMPYVWSIRRYPDVEKLNLMASCLHGEIDCTTFTYASDLSESKHRFLEKALFYQQGDELIFEITANAFLWKMVRSITGSLIEFEGKGYDTDYFEKALLAKDRKLAGITAPANGLFLWNVSYEGVRKHK